MKKTPKKKSNSKIKHGHEITELPSQNAEMEEYVLLHRNEINDQILNSIEYALKNKLGTIDLFCFKNSNFIVMLHRKDFKESLEDILAFGLNNQKFELCTRTKALIRLLNKISFVVRYQRVI